MSLNGAQTGFPVPYSARSGKRPADCNVIRYNANDNPTKQTAFSQYDRPQARRRYAEIADHLGLSAPGDRTAAKIEKTAGMAGNTES